MIATLILRLRRRRVAASVAPVGLANKFMDDSISTTAWPTSEQLLLSRSPGHFDSTLSLLHSVDSPSLQWSGFGKPSMVCPTLYESVPDATTRPLKHQSVPTFWHISAFEILETMASLGRIHALWCLWNIGGHSTKVQKCFIYTANHSQYLRKGISFPPLLPVTKINCGNYTAQNCDFIIAPWVGDSLEEPKKMKTEHKEVKCGRRANSKAGYPQPSGESLVNDERLSSLPRVDSGMRRLRTKGAGDSSGPKCGSSGKLYGSRQVCRRGNSSRKMKRSRQEDFDETDEEEDERKRRKKRRREEEEGTSELPGNRRFGCPYYKRSPRVDPKATSCVFPGFQSLARLKYVHQAHS